MQKKEDKISEAREQLAIKNIKYLPIINGVQSEHTGTIDINRQVEMVVGDFKRSEISGFLTNKQK